MDTNKKIHFIIINEFYQLQDRLMKSGFDSNLILLVINGMRAKALEEVNAILLSDLAQADIASQKKDEETEGSE